MCVDVIAITGSAYADVISNSQKLLNAYESNKLSKFALCLPYHLCVAMC